VKKATCALEILKQRRVDLEAGVELLIARESLTAEQFAPSRFPRAPGGQLKKRET
jgi:cell division protease FtsH